MLQLQHDIAAGAPRFLGASQILLGECHQAIGIGAVIGEAGHAYRQPGIFFSTQVAAGRGNQAV